MDKKFLRILEPGVRLIFFVLMLFICISAFLNFYVFLAELAVFIMLYLYHMRTNRARQKEIIKYIETLTYHVDSAAKNSILNFPMPVAIIRPNGLITWYNDKFSELLNSDTYLFERRAEEILPGFNAETISESSPENPFRTSIGDRNFCIYATVVSTGQSKGLITLYLIEETELVKAKKEIMEHRSIVGIVMLDNYEEIFQNAKEIEKANAIALVDKRISAWAAAANAVIQKVERDKFLFVMEEPELQSIIDSRFSILDSVKEIMVGTSKMPITLSIGIGKGVPTFVLKYEFASSAIEVALGRGGDQAVIKTDDAFEYYGGRSKEMEKRTKVKSRVVATALKELIIDCDTVYVMGHKYADADSIGAAVGIYRVAKNYGKKCNIVVSATSSMVDKVVDMLHENHDYANAFIYPSEALSAMNDSRTLLVVVDTHNFEYVESKELLDACSRVVVIDHHRRGENFIENSVLLFQEPYASSACEMVSEMLQYLDENSKLSREEANALLAGIILDTKGFTVKTGVRTFETASYLKRAGADTIEAKLLFQNDLDAYKAKVNFISSTETYKAGIAVACSENEDGKLTKDVFGQAVDEMLNISEIKVAFGIAKFDGIVHISGRSYGAINVQVIIEKLGGGGHQTTAGVQLKNISVEDAKIRLLTLLDQIDVQDEA